MIPASVRAEAGRHAVQADGGEQCVKTAMYVWSAVISSWGSLCGC